MKCPMCKLRFTGSAARLPNESCVSHMVHYDCFPQGPPPNNFTCPYCSTSGPGVQFGDLIPNVFVQYSENREWEDIPLEEENPEGGEEENPGVGKIPKGGRRMHGRISMLTRPVCTAKERASSALITCRAQVIGPNGLALRRAAVCSEVSVSFGAAILYILDHKCSKRRGGPQTSSSDDRKTEREEKVVLHSFLLCRIFSTAGYNDRLQSARSALHQPSEGI